MSLACGCGQDIFFSLKEYDEASQIVELKVLNKIEKGGYDYNIQVLEVYKGSISSDKVILNSGMGGTSCYWAPTIGETYILYLENPEIENNKEVLQFGGLCSRTIGANGENYKSESEILTRFKDKLNGNFEFDQFDLIWWENSAEKFVTVLGQFENGKRHGIWKLSEPYRPSDENLITGDIFVELKYNQGKLLEVQRYAKKKIYNKDKEVASLYQFYKLRVRQ